MPERSMPAKAAYGWPRLVRSTAAAYLDMSTASFLGEVARGGLPAGAMFNDRARWDRLDIDVALDSPSERLAASSTGARRTLFARVDHRRANPCLDTASKQIAWIDYLKLEEGSLFREGERVFRLAEDGTLRQVRVGVIDPAGLIEVADGD